jgi:DUF4097 and DUF4098 domain-containing protein YvlB
MSTSRASTAISKRRPPAATSTSPTFVGKVVARTSSGDVIARNVRGDSDLKTSGGDIRATIDGKIAAHTSGGNVTAELVGANRGISVSSSGGDLTIRVPKSTTGELEASTSGGSVRTELPVTTTEMGEHKLTGTINGGGNPIYAHTSGGSIKLVATTATAASSNQPSELAKAGAFFCPVRR